ncbi:hypothetical protein GCM10022250_07150 [Flavobacterium chungbukense]|uniref:Uncharacterized protein n=1 Tax=Flavobacterium chungbukense TaxID=877464 RepID=A0ABP7XPQ3_9FLAO
MITLISVYKNIFAGFGFPFVVKSLGIPGSFLKYPFIYNFRGKVFPSQILSASNNLLFTLSR